MKKFMAMAAAALAAICCFGFVGCAQKGEQLIVYTEAGFAPWETTSGTKVVGVDMEIAQAIADELGWRLKIVNGNFNTIMAGINETNALGIAGITVNEERSAVLEFSDTYATARQAIVFKKGELTKQEDGTIPKSVFEGKVVGVQTATTGDLLANDADAGLGISVVKGFEQVAAAVVAMDSSVDYVMIDSLVAKQLVANNASKLDWAIIDGVEEESYAIAAKKGNTELIATVNKVLAELKQKDENGQSQIDKWLIEYSK